MTPRWRAFVRTALIAAGGTVVLVALPSFRLTDWPIYLVYLLVAGLHFSLSVEVLPRLGLNIPEMATTIGFLYVGGLPIAVLRLFAPLVAQALSHVVPGLALPSLPQLMQGPRDDHLPIRWGAGAYHGTIVLWAVDMLAFGIRWWVVSQFTTTRPPNTLAIALAEVCGYVCWGIFSVIPVYETGTLLPLESGAGYRTALTDIGLIIWFALTPFVFLIPYSYRAHGVVEAGGWALAALGPHAMLKRLSERRRRLEEQNRRLEQLNRELEHRERLSAIGKMSSVVSHQILHQLGVIGVYADLIRNEDGDNEPQVALTRARENAAAIEGALRDVNRVLTDLLVFSKDLRLNLYEHSLDRIVVESVEECRPLATGKQVDLVLERGPAVDVSVDKLKIKQTLGNIIGNAIEVSQPGTVVTIRTGTAGGAAEVTVSDRGPGVPTADREAIFTPFFTTKEHGTGLGLAIAREFAEAHGGRLYVEDRADRPGATFALRLPLTESDQREARSQGYGKAKVSTAG